MFLLLVCQGMPDQLGAEQCAAYAGALTCPTNIDLMPKKTLNETDGIAVGLRYSALLNAKSQHRRGEWGEGVQSQRGN